MGCIQGFVRKWFVLVGLVCSAAHPAWAELQISFPDLSEQRGLFTTAVQVNGDQLISSLNISLATSLVSGDPGSSLVIESFDPFAPEDSIWTGLPLLFAATPPGLPSSMVKLNNTIASPVDKVMPQGSVFSLVFDATNTRPGDVFQLDLNYNNRTTAASGGDLITDLAFFPGTVTILAPSGDFNQDGVLDASDINLLTSAVKEESQDLSFDLDADGKVDQADRDVWVNDLKQTYYGDANFDGEFDSGDFIFVLQKGEYEDDVEGNSVWESGDWTGDCEFDSGDLVKALQTGAYEQGPRAAVSAVASVPEPTSWVLIAAGLVSLMTYRRHACRGESKAHIA